MPLIQITAPATTPVSVAEVKAAGRIDGSEFDSQLAIIIPGITRNAEALIGRVIVPRTMELVLDDFPVGEIDLILPNVISIASVKYVDTAGNTQTLAPSAYSLDADSTPCWLLPAIDTAWPDAIASANAVRVRFDAGFSTVPEDIKLWLIAKCLEQIHKQKSDYVDGLLDSYRMYHF